MTFKTELSAMDRDTLLRILCLNIILLVSAVDADASSAGNLRQISSREGISNNSILALAQDSEGYVLFGTCDGLNTWNGEEVASYPQPGSGLTPLSGNLIEEILPAGDGCFWIRTNYGLDLFDSGEVTESYGMFQGMYKISCRSPHEILVLTQSDSLYSYSSSYSGFVNIGKPSDVSYGSLLEMFLSEDGRLWFFSMDGISFSGCRMDGDMLSVSEGPSEKSVYDVRLKYAFRKQDNVFLVGEDDVLYSFRPADEELRYIVSLEPLVSRYGPVSDVIADGDDYYVSFLSDGAVRVIYTPEKPDKYSFERLDIDCGVFSLIKDSRQDIVWIGTDGQGVYMLAKYPITFRSYTYSNFPYRFQKPVRAINMDRYGNMWMGTKGEGMICIRSFWENGMTDEKDIRHVTVSNSSLSDPNVYAIENSSRNLMWIGTEGKGLDYWSFDDGKVHRLTGDLPDDLQYVHAIHEADRNTLWVATVGCGVFRLDLSDGAVPECRSYEKIDFGAELDDKKFFFTLYPDIDGTIFFGNRGGGLVHYDPVTGESCIYTFGNGESNTTNDIWSICRGSDGHLWLGTSYGLISVGDDFSWSVASSFRGTVHGILEDENGHLWLSTNRGLVRYVPSTGDTMTYGYSYGIGTIEYSDGAIYKDAETGHMLFGGTNGFVAVHRNRYEPADYRPELTFRTVRINDMVCSVRSRIGRNGVMRLSPDEKLYELDIDALDYINSSNYIFYYYIKGVEPVWKPVSRKIRFADLAPGRYTVHVRYVNTVNSYNSPEYTLRLRLEAPWYASIVARMVYAILFIGVMMFIFRSFMLRRRRKRAEQIKKAEHKRKEEAYNSKMLLLDNFAQELSTPLTLISVPCQQIIDYGESDDYIRMHGEKILQQSYRLHSWLKLFHDFKESSIPDMKKFAEELSISELIQEISASYSVYAKDRGISFSTGIDGEIMWNTGQEGLLSIVNMLLTNAFAYVPKDGFVRIDVSVEKERLRITVASSGAGLSPEKVAMIFDRFSVMDVFQQKSEQRSSFQNEMRLAVCNNLVSKLGGRLTTDFRNGVMSFTAELPSLEVRTDEHQETSVPEIHSAYISEIGLNLSPEMGTDELRNVELVKEKQMMFIAGKNAELMNNVAELFSSDYNIRFFSQTYELENAFESVHPDIVICENVDVRQDMISMIRRMKENKFISHIPVILLTTMYGEDENIKGVESGADACISIPFNVKYLKAVVEQLRNRLESLHDYYHSTVSAYEFTRGRMLHREDKEFLDRMLKIIGENISNSDMTTAFIAGQLGMSVRSLYHKLDGLIDVTPSSIIKDYRLIYAERLLVTTKLSIEEIIFKSGFANRGTFFKNFSAKYGSTPKAYREMKLRDVVEH